MKTIPLFMLVILVFCVASSVSAHEGHIHEQTEKNPSLTAHAAHMVHYLLLGGAVVAAGYTGVRERIKEQRQITQGKHESA